MLKIHFIVDTYMYVHNSINNNCISTCIATRLWDYIKHTNIWATSWENLSCDDIRLKLACSATEAIKCLLISRVATIDIILSRQWTTKALIILSRFASWPASLLFTHIFSWHGSFSTSLPFIHYNIGHNTKCRYCIFATFQEKQKNEFR